METASAATQHLLAGKYEIIRLIGTGGMAQVFLAKQRALSQLQSSSPSDNEGAALDGFVVVKMILPALAGNKHVVAMFRDELRIATLLHHPNVVGVLDVGMAQGAPFIVMEYLHGQNLSRVAARARDTGKPLPLDVALDIVKHASLGLDHAHTRTDAAGTPLAIVHRDVTPQNIVVTYDGRIKLIDFGIAKAAVQKREATKVGQVKGKLRYLSPEQLIGGALDARSDVFALGVILFELTTTRRLFSQKSAEAVALAISSGDYPKPSDVVADYPRELEEVVMRALATRPAQRQQSSGELAVEIARVMAAKGMTSSRQRLSEYLRALFADDVDDSAIVTLEKEPQRTAVRVNPWARPAAPVEPADAATASLAGAGVDSVETATVAPGPVDATPRDDEDRDADDDTLVGWPWTGLDPRGATGPTSSDTASDPTKQPAAPSSSVPWATASLVSVPTVPLAATRWRALALPGAAAAVVLVALLTIALWPGDEEAQARVTELAHGGAVDVDVPVAEPADAGAGVVVAAAVAADAVEDIEERAPEPQAEPEERERVRKKSAKALPALPRDASLAKKVAWLDANCRARVACAGDVVERKRTLGNATLPLATVRAFPDDVDACVRQCQR